MSFKKLQIKDKPQFEKFFQNNDRMGCEYTFACNFIWQDVFNSTFDIVCGAYVAKTVRENETVYNFPLGEEKDVIAAVNHIMSIEKENTVFRGIMECQLDFINKHFPNMFAFSSNRNESDYVYLSENLITLSGKKFQAKRNLIKRFCDNPNWVYEEISKENIDKLLYLRENYYGVTGKHPGYKHYNKED